VKVVTYNLDHYDPLGFNEIDFQYPDTGVPNRFALIEEIVRGLDPDILLVQEIFGNTHQQAYDNACYLANATGLLCRFYGTKSRYHNLATGILWHPRVEPISISIDAEGFWHPFCVMTVEVNGTPISHACYHGQPAGRLHQAGRDTRSHEAQYLIELSRHIPYFLIGGDWNSLGAAQLNNGAFYDTAPDPTELLAAGVTDAQVNYLMDRTPATLLRAASLVDIVQQGPQIYTRGHRPSNEGSWRLDRFYATSAMAAEVLATETIVNEATLVASDHLPVVVYYNS
jgi:endonuclease/exonuclease/phosphatase family metal-dependent hydrolase